MQHHITLTKQANGGWTSFLPPWNGRAVFLDTNVTAPDETQLFKDVFGAKGFRACFAGDWLRDDCHHSNFLTIHSSCRSFLPFWLLQQLGPVDGKVGKSGSNCDNEALVNDWQRMSTKPPRL